MHITPTTYTVVDYCEAMTRKEIIVNRDYQRSEKVWPAPARSFLIESILLGYPIPKLYLYQVTDLKSRKTIKHIVDGQQRSYTILEYYQDKLELSRTSEIVEVRGKKFSELPVEYQQRFVDYALSVDLFVSATGDEIREVFRRINSYTVPLNPEEKRHSLWQGEFKWFVYKLSKKYDPILVSMKVFQDRQLARMADAKLFSEIAYALINGITTTTAKNLDKLYKEYDPEFPHANQVESRVAKAVNTILEWQEIHGTALMKPYMFYALVLAVSHLGKPIDKLQATYEPSRKFDPKRRSIIENLSALAEALEEPERERERFVEFVSASAKTTNDAKRRTVIFRWLCQAIDLDGI